MATISININMEDEAFEAMRKGGAGGRKILSQICDSIIEEFSSSEWYQRNIPAGAPDQFEKAMCKSMLAFMILEKSRLQEATASDDTGGG